VLGCFKTSPTWLFAGDALVIANGSRAGTTCGTADVDLALVAMTTAGTVHQNTRLCDKIISISIFE